MKYIKTYKLFECNENQLFEQSDNKDKYEIGMAYTIKLKSKYDTPITPGLYQHKNETKYIICLSKSVEEYIIGITIGDVERIQGEIHKDFVGISGIPIQRFDLHPITLEDFFQSNPVFIKKIRDLVDKRLERPTDNKGIIYGLKKVKDVLKTDKIIRLEELDQLGII